MVLNAERFVSAWTRFREQYSDDQLTEQHEIMIRQYLNIAKALQDTTLPIHDPEQLASILQQVCTIEQDCTQLINMKYGSLAMKTPVIPRAADIIRRRKALTEQKHAEAQKLLIDTTRKQREDTSIETDPVHPPNSDFSHSDFQSMLEDKSKVEEKLSTHDIRKRMGLLDRSNQSHAQDDTMIHEEQESIQTDMVNLAKTLKQKTESINQSLVEDVKILEAVGQSAESNTALLDRENAVLKQQIASSIGFWTSLWLVMGAVITFMVMYIYIKLFSRQQWS